MPKRRANFEGTIYPDRTGWRAMLTLDDGRRISKRFPPGDAGQDMADAWLTEQRHKIHKGQFIAPNDKTLGEWLIDWLQIYSKQNVRQRTYERYLSLAKHCKDIADYNLQDLKPLNFQKLYVSLGEYSGETRKKVHNLLHAALDQAVHEQLIPFNPVASVTPPKVVREEVVTFSQDEVEALLAAAREHRWYAPLLLATHTGMRLGEVLGLRWMDVDLDEKCVYVRQTLQYANKGIIFEPPKSKAGKRKISVPDETVAVLQAIKPEKPIPKSLCFVSANNTPIQPKNFERWWTDLQLEVNDEWQELEKQRKALLAKDVSQDSKQYQAVTTKQKEAKEARHKKFHALRHTHATELLASGENIMDVARRLGHSKASTTLDLYGHAMPANDQRIAAKIGKLYKLETEKSQSSE